MSLSEASTAAGTPSAALAALESRISALKYVDALLRVQRARKDGNAWRKAAEAAQSLLRNGRDETYR
jgi:hypothetical protein